MTGATPWFFQAQVGTVQIETISVGSAQRPSAGATDPVTVVYPNTQASNGWAVQLGIPSIPAPVTGPLSRWVGGVRCR